MRPCSAAIALALLALGCGGPRAHEGPPPPCSPGQTATLEADVSLSCLAEGVWVVTVLAPPTFELPGYPANALLVEAPDHAVLVDTGWNDAQSEVLRVFAASRGRPLSAALATHFHDDRVGGAAALEAAGVPVFATADTIARARAAGNAVPDHVLTEDAIPEIAWLFPGPAHSPDNVVVFHRPSGTLFGGCMIKELAAPALGNVADADLAAWPAALEAVRQAFPDAIHVVPGHGAVGDLALLGHTAALLPAP